MKKILLIAASVLAVSGAPAFAQTATDALGKCLVDSSTGKDRAAFSRWMFLALAADPSVQAMTNITEGQKKEIYADAGGVMNRLILKDCRKEAVTALHADGDVALEKSFGEFGKMAMVDLMGNDNVKAVLAGLGNYVDQDGMAALGKEAGAPAKP